MDKPPILSLYEARYHVFGISFAKNPSLAYYFITLLTIGVTSAISLVYFYKRVKPISYTLQYNIIVTVVVGTGTVFFPYSTLFNNHTFSGALLMIATYLLVQFITS